MLNIHMLQAVSRRGAAVVQDQSWGAHGWTTPERNNPKGPQPMGNPGQARNTSEGLQPTGGPCWGRGTKEQKGRNHHVKLQQTIKGNAAEILSTG